MMLLGRKKKKPNTTTGAGWGGGAGEGGKSDRLHELTVRYKAARAQAGRGAGPGAPGLRAAAQGRRTEARAPSGCGLAQRPSPARVGRTSPGATSRAVILTLVISKRYFGFPYRDRLRAEGRKASLQGF